MQILNELTLNSGEGYTADFVVHNNKLYTGTKSIPAIIAEIDLLTFQETRSLQLDSGSGQFYTLGYDGTYLYAGTYTGTTLYKIDFISFSILDRLTLPANGITSLEVKNGYMYAGFNISPTIIIKINLNTFQIDNSLILDETSFLQSKIVIDNNYIYLGTWTIPAKLIRVDLNTLTKVDSITLSDNYARSMLIYNNKLYIGSAIGNLFIFDIPTYTQENKILIPSTYTTIMSIIPYGTSLYMSAKGDPSEIVEFSLSSLSVVDRLIVTYPHTDANWYGIYPITFSNNYLYYAVQSLPSIIVKVATSACISNWQCEQPLNGYENDGCGNRRPSLYCCSEPLCNFTLTQI